MLEVIAYFLMFFDHIAKFLKMRINNFNPILGIISFPIFAYMVARALRLTKDKDKYILRLLIFSFVSQIPYILMIFGTPHINNMPKIIDKIIYILNFFTQKLNVGFTLLLGALGVKMIENNKENNLNKIIFILIFAISADLLEMDYGGYGVFLIILFYYIKTLPKMVLYMAGLNFVNILYTYFFVNDIRRNQLLDMKTRLIIGILAIPLIFLFGIRFEEKYKNKKVKENTMIDLENKNNTKNVVMKILKYSIYPVHMLLIYLATVLNIFV